MSGKHQPTVCAGWLSSKPCIVADGLSGLYEQQDPDQIDSNLRGQFTTNSNGDYGFYCIRPTPYPVPFDGPAGKILKLLDRHPYRPAHIHIIVSQELQVMSGRDR